MKKILFSLIFLSIGLIIKSQTLELYTLNNVLLAYGDTISVDSLSTATDSLSFSKMSAAVNVKNVSGSSKNVFCEKQPQSVIAGTENAFCWGSCFPPTTYISPNPVILASGASSGFTGDYSPKNKIGTSIIRYVFKILHGDSAWINVKYNANYSGISNNSFSSSISAPYPNPANSNVSINYSILNSNNASIQIYNIYGILEKQFSVQNTNGVVNINVSDLHSGIYFYSLNLNGVNVKTNSFIVSH